MQESFNYFLNIRRNLIVISWNGELKAPDGNKIQECLKEVLKTPPRYIIMNCQGFTGYDPVLASDLVNFQEKLRKLPALLMITGMGQEVKEKLSTRGLIKEEEFVPTLQDALQIFLQIGSANA